MNDTTYPLTLYFDGSCPLCQREMNFLVARDRRCRLRLIDVSRGDFANDTGVATARLMARMHARRGDGTLVDGIEVFRLAYQAVGLGWLVRPLAWPLLAPALDRLYTLVARHRNRVPQWCSALLFGHAGRRGGCRNGRCMLPGGRP
jgi:predicted DCC family thiol-disulfide oxidoreductase YuxK